MIRRGLERGTAGKPAWIDHGQRDGVDQHPRISGARCSEKPVAGTFFDHSALAHDHHPLTDRANNRKVMTDEGERQTHFACVETSSPETISSARTKSGRSITARAMPTR